jgi:hypothetical protein
LGGSTIGTPYAATKYTFSPATYSYYKIVLSNGYQAASAVGIYSIGFYINVTSIGNNIKIRSLAGGNAYLGTDSKLSLSDKNLGAYPTNNEWDKYIVKSNLNGKITPGDDSIWNWNSGFATWCKETQVANFVRNDGTSLNSRADCRTTRGYYKDYAESPVINDYMFPITTPNVSGGGFRPVLEYLDDSRCTNAWY